jgi:hypothetical protein
MWHAIPDPPPSDRELIDLWTATFGEPPPIVHDPPFMMQLIEGASAPQRLGAVRQMEG